MPHNRHYVKLRARMARALVRWSSRWWQASFNAHNRVQGRYETAWTKGARRVEDFAIPLAKRLDPEATGGQMIEESWWG